MSTIRPQYKLLIVYDVQPDKHDLYYRYILGEFVPALRELGLHMLSAWHVTYGHYPARQIEFVCENRDVLQSALKSARFESLERRLQSYTDRYQRKLVMFEDRFQF
jgi:hypothetical protein